MPGNEEILFMFKHNCPLALEEFNLCAQDCRLDFLKKSPEDKGSADWPGTENGVRYLFHYPHSHSAKTAHWSKGHQNQTPEDGGTSEWGERGKPELLDLIYLPLK